MFAFHYFLYNAEHTLCQSLPKLLIDVTMTIYIFKNFPNNNIAHLYKKKQKSFVNL